MMSTVGSVSIGAMAAIDAVLAFVPESRAADRPRIGPSSRGSPAAEGIGYLGADLDAPPTRNGLRGDVPPARPLFPLSDDWRGANRAVAQTTTVLAVLRRYSATTGPRPAAVRPER